MAAGLPPDGSSAQFVGFDKDGAAYILQWRQDYGVWVGAGFNRPHGEDDSLPLIFSAADAWAEFIVRHEALPKWTV